MILVSAHEEMFVIVFFHNASLIRGQLVFQIRPALDKRNLKQLCFTEVLFHYAVGVLEIIMVHV